jgi:hypothetical protein
VQAPRQQVAVARVAITLPSSGHRGDQLGQGIPWRPTATESVGSLLGFRSRERVRGHRSEAAVGIDNQHLVMAGQSSAGARRQAGDLALLGLAVLMRGADLMVEASARGGEDSCRGSARRWRGRGPVIGQSRAVAAASHRGPRGGSVREVRNEREREGIAGRVLTQARPGLMGRNGPTGPAGLNPLFGHLAKLFP